MAATLLDEPLAPRTTLRVGGPARRLVEATTEDELVSSVTDADRTGEPLLLLAGGSNVLIADAGFGGTVVQVATRGLERAPTADGARLTVAAGEPWDGLVALAVDEGLAGLECLSGIPGSAGATPIQNVGAYGQEVASTVVAVRALDRRDGGVVELAPEDCGFGYRASAFKGDDRFVVLSVTFELQRSELSAPLRYAELARTLGVDAGEPAPLREVRDAVLGLRRAKGMVLDPGDHDTWSAGSFFTNPVLEQAAFDELARRAGAAPPRFAEPGGRVKTSAAWLIERAGYTRGTRRGAVALSGKHALAITNRGGASAADVVAFAVEIAGTVHERFGVALVPEPVLVGVDWPPAA